MKASPVKNFLSLVKFSHTIFALPFALIGYFLAIKFSIYTFDWVTFIPMLLCMVFARNAAMAFNRYIDRDIDSANERTAKVREIPNGTITPNSAKWFVIGNSILFIATTYFINSICFYLSPVALAVVLGYSLTKRFTALCHLILGIGLALAPIGAYLVVVGSFAWLPLYFSFAVLFWVSGFDIIYALQDYDFDKKMNLKSIPVFLGKDGALGFSTFLHLLTAGFIIFAGYKAGFGTFYWIGTALFLALLTYQHLIVKANDLSKVNLAFFTTNGVASVLFAVFTILELLFPL
ncbi:UbiA-like polyprenyltransferase [Acidiluteibacter ferrifornacis]|uniref:4-hydroxybenzoate polyprenyltransferase n=1 Tax=Acidiluteibacter ferrifornacis TaxID=2692424 RepID=A0A6N9NJG3_9FLAO|nr:UbiA-like polyprenyltransferase [Acidiluteibacter ferrifornacis]NBG66826.1 4-hydroxybenzoate octaprenyltransferase [Acidiluteibacter ferrifornacis]